MRPVLAALLLPTTACLAMMRPAAPTPRTADNPLISGQPLEVTSKSDVGVVSEPDCNIWPFEDRLTVSVTEAQICVELHKNTAAPPGWTGEPTASRTEGMQIANDANEGGYVNAEKTRAAKVGSCFNRGFNDQVAIWAFDYKVCAPNNGTVTRTTRSLRVGDEAWEFAGAAPAPAVSGAGPGGGG